MKDKNVHARDNIAVCGFNISFSPFELPNKVAIITKLAMKVSPFKNILAPYCLIPCSQ
jgi:hypothetical protein